MDMASVPVVITWEASLPVFPAPLALDDSVNVIPDSDSMNRVESVKTLANCSDVLTVAGIFSLF